MPMASFALRGGKARLRSHPGFLREESISGSSSPTKTPITDQNERHIPTLLLFKDSQDITNVGKKYEIFFARLCCCKNTGKEDTVLTLVNVLSQRGDAGPCVPVFPTDQRRERQKQALRKHV